MFFKACSTLNTIPGCTETKSQRSDIPLQHYFEKESRAEGKRRQSENGELHNTRRTDLCLSRSNRLQILKLGLCELTVLVEHIITVSQ